MPVRATVALLRELDPEGSRVPSSQPSHRRLPRAAATLAAASVIAVVGSLMTGGDSRAPGLAEAAYAALTAPDRIVHLQLRSQYFHPVDQPTTTHVWTRGGADELRVVYDGGAHEFVRDTDERYAAAYVRRSNTLTIHTDPAMWEFRTDEELDFAGPEGAARIAEVLPALLARARDGDPAVQRLPDAELDGRLAARLETVMVVRMTDEEPIRGRVPETKPTPIRTVVWLDLDTHLPRRIERFAGDRREATTEVVAEQLQVDDETERLLDIPPHPDARRVVSGRR